MDPDPYFSPDDKLRDTARFQCQIIDPLKNMDMANKVSIVMETLARVSRIAGGPHIRERIRQVDSRRKAQMRRIKLCQQ
jgi:hypothetical protein